MTCLREPIDLEYAITSRYYIIGWPYIGPLTREQQESYDKYEAHMEAEWEEHQAQQRAGGRAICPECGQRNVKHRSVCTLGYSGHPGAEFSVYSECENCDYKEI